jgi:hypothetical protein
MDLPRAAAAGLRARLTEFVAKQWDGVRARLEEKAGIQHSTMVKWFPRKKGVAPKVPDLGSLFRVSERTGLSLDWLLFGGSLPMLRGTAHNDHDLGTELEKRLLAAITPGRSAAGVAIAEGKIRGRGEILIRQLETALAAEITEAEATIIRREKRLHAMLTTGPKLGRLYDSQPKAEFLTTVNQLLTNAAGLGRE